MNNSNKSSNIESHPDWYYNIPIMKILILGSYPPHPKRYSYPFYYPHKRNHFWKILADIAKTPLVYFEGEQAVLERKSIMIKLKVGVENMGRIIEREGESALDTKINIIGYNDILKIIVHHKELARILLPGFHAPNSTAKSFINYLIKENIKHTKPDLFKPEQMFTLFLNNREIECVILNSTSPAFKRKHDGLVPQFSKYIKL